jgi:hypothetical protein
MKRLTALITLGFATALAGCADISTPLSPGAPVPSGPMPSSDAYPSSFSQGFGLYGYHSEPYDNTGNNPGEYGLEGGGG